MNTTNTSNKNGHNKLNSQFIDRNLISPIIEYLCNIEGNLILLDNVFLNNALEDNNGFNC